MKKYIVYIIGFMSCCMTSLEAQQDAISNHYWVTPSVNNPALIGMFNDSTINISGSMLDYWAVMPNAPRAINIALEMPIKAKNIAIGAFFQQEEYFLFKESRGSLSFNYRAKFSDDIYLRIGLGVGFLENRINFSAVSAKDMNDDLILNGIQTQRALQLSLSFGFRYKQLCIGTSVPYFVINKNSKVGLLNYGNDNPNSTSFRKPFFISHYLKQSLLNRKKIDPNKHLLDISALVNVNTIISTKMYVPNDVRLNLLYRLGHFAGKKGKNVAADVLKLDALKFGAGYRVSWKNSTTNTETNKKAGHIFNLMFGFEIGKFLEIDYIIGINTQLESIGTTHEVICKIKIGKGNKNTNNSRGTDKWNNELENLKLSVDSLENLHDSIRVDMDTILLKTIPSLELEIEELKSETERLEKESQLNKKELKEKIKELEDELEIWKQIVGGKQNVGVEIKTPPNSTVIKKK